MLKAKFPNLHIRDRLLLYSSVDEKGCWLWQGIKFERTGYGQVTHEKRVYSTHRMSMHVFKSFDLKSKALILHRCDVKHCINPDHLYVGTKEDNARDSMERGQQVKGSTHPNAKLSEDKVKEIWKLIALGKAPKDIAARFNVDVSTINLIKRRKTWTHVRSDSEVGRN
jgi:hypothetical protein